MIARLLDSRNKCLQKILELSRGFAAEAEGGSFASLPLFEKKRASLFRALELHEKKLTALISALTPAQRTPDLIARARTATQLHSTLVAQVTSVDNRIMELIEREKQAVQEAVSISRKHKAVTHKFKSTWMPESGEGLDQKL